MPKKSNQRPGLVTRLLNTIGYRSATQHEFEMDMLEKQYDAELIAAEEAAVTRDRKAMEQWDEAKALAQDDLLKAAMYDVWMYSANCVIQSVIAMLPWKITRATTLSDGEPGREVVTDCKTHQLFTHPNPGELLTWYDLIEATAGYLESVGEGYWLLFNKTSDGKQLDHWRIKYLRPDKMAVVLDPTTQKLKGWNYNPNEEDKSKKRTEPDYDPDNIVQFKYFNPRDRYSGLASGVPAWESIRTDRASRKVNRTRVENHFDSHLMIEFDKDAPYTSEQRKELARQLRAKAKPKYAGETRVLPPGAKVNRDLSEDKDMQYGKLQEQVIQEVSAATGVPAAILGASQEFNRANINGLLYVLYQLTIKPKTFKIAAKINYQVGPAIDPERWDKEDMRFEFDFSGVEALKQDPVKAAQAVRLLTGRAVQTANEARHKMGMVSHDGDDADALYVKSGDRSPTGHTPELEPETEVREQKSALGVDYTKYGKKLYDPNRVDKDRAEESPNEFALWEMSMEVLQPIETRIKSKIRNMATRQQDDILKTLRRKWEELEDNGVVAKSGKRSINLYHSFGKRFKKADPLIPEDEFEEIMDELIGHIDGQGDWLVSVSTPELEKAILAGAELHAEQLVEGFDFSMKNKKVKGWVKETGKRIRETIPETTLSHFQSAMYDTWMAGGDLVDLENTVQKQLGALIGPDDWRTELIARTESTSAFNFGAVESYRQAKIPGTKVWLAAFDDRVRDWHLDVEPVLKADAPFTVYGPSGAVTMVYPGDPGGGAENVCNCRCTVAFYPKT